MMSPLPICTLNDGTVCIGIASFSTMALDIKLCVDPLSTRIRSCLSLISPCNFNVAPTEFPKMAWKLISASSASAASLSKLPSASSCSGDSSSVIFRREREESLHLWPGWNFSLHLKQRPFASHACRSASDGRDWVGNAASEVEVKGARELTGAAECEIGRSRFPGGRENDPKALAWLMKSKWALSGLWLCWFWLQILRPGS